jgi:hypothetical protein
MLGAGMAHGRPCRSPHIRYRVYRMEIDEQGKKLKLWVRRKKAGLRLILFALRATRAGGQISHVSR